MITFRKVIITAAVVALSFSVNLGSSANVGFGVSKAQACSTRQTNCVDTDGLTWKGKGRMKVLIHNVTVCHKYFDLLSATSFKGSKARWWMPVMKRGGWYGDLPGYTKQCTTFADFTPGTEVRVFARCVDRLITTGAIYKSGTYWLD